MTASITTQTLTAEDLKALRRADSVSFHHRQDETYLVASLRSLSEPRVYTAAEQRLFPNTDLGGDRTRRIDVSGRVQAYDRSTVRRAVDGGSAFAMVHSGQYNDVWRTITSLLKAGDDLHLDFTGDKFANQYSRTAGLHLDVLSLVVRRGPTRLVFTLDVAACPDNTARMVQGF